MGQFGESDTRRRPLRFPRGGQYAMAGSDNERTLTGKFDGCAMVFGVQTGAMQNGW